MQWKFSGDKPVYQQIMEILRCAVLAGEYPPGSRIEAVRELAMAANVNPNTMQRALAELEREGLLVCCGTMGRFVTSDQTVLEGAARQARIEAARACKVRLEAFGLTFAEAARLLNEEKTP